MVKKQQQQTKNKEEGRGKTRSDIKAKIPGMPRNKKTIVMMRKDAIGKGEELTQTTELVSEDISCQMQIP